MINAVMGEPLIIEIVEQEPVIDVLVGDGLNGRRGSYTFTGALTDPATASTYTEITGNPDVLLLEYDIYISTANQNQWQYRYAAGGLQWILIYESIPTNVRFFRSTLTGVTNGAYIVTHNFNTRDVSVQVYENFSPYSNVICAVTRPNTSSVQLQFLRDDATPRNYRVLIMAY